ncbi:MAG: 3'(2'),5'-bisphosphate nucleotidase CysQ [Planctomycetota bacterium]|nr:MAG: 3'(2'),5'-bisphosphate nucleotidase CysQ [Planctomycetota bacterium]
MNTPSAQELAFVRELALEAGKIVMGYADMKGVDVDDKDGQPVTVADRESNDLIMAELAKRFPNDAILSEETPVENNSWTQAERCWVVDPLDGTSDFVKGRVGFAVMIGLLHKGRPALGAVHVPKAGRTFLGLVGEGAEEERDGERHTLSVSSRADSNELRCICSIAHRDEALERAIAAIDPAEQLSVGSVGYKVGKIVADEADMYIAPTSYISLWDTCGPEAILHAAGGRFLNVDGEPLDYSGPGLKHKRGLLATNGACADAVVTKISGLFPDI